MITCESCDRFLTLKVTGYENGRISITNLKSLAANQVDSNKNIQNSNQNDQNPNKDNQNANNLQNSNKNILNYNFFPHSGPVTSISFGTIEEVPYFISSGCDGKLIQWNNLSGTWSYKILHKSEIPITSASFSCDSSLIAFVDQEGNVKYIDLKNNEVSKPKTIQLIEDQNLFGSKNKEIRTDKYGIYQVSFILMPDHPHDTGFLVIVTPNGELQIFDKDNENEYSMKSKYQISKSYVKCITPLNYCYIAGICFGNIVRVLDLRMNTLSEINLDNELQYFDVLSDDDTNFYRNDNPICSLYWEEPLRRLVICLQKNYRVLNKSQDASDVNRYKSYIIPTIATQEFKFTKDTLGAWKRIEYI